MAGPPAITEEEQRYQAPREGIHLFAVVGVGQIYLSGLIRLEITAGVRFTWIASERRLEFFSAAFYETGRNLSELLKRKAARAACCSRCRK